MSVLEGTEATDVQIDEVIRQLMAASPWKLEIIAALGLDSVDPSDQGPGTQDPKLETLVYWIQDRCTQALSTEVRFVP